MSRLHYLENRFVQYIPEVLDDGVLYISVEFATASHACCCGCRNEVVTPIDPEGWTLSFDGVTVSFSPSIGNWQLTCRSHYWICRNRVRWAERYSDHDNRRLRPVGGRGRFRRFWSLGTVFQDWFVRRVCRKVPP